MEYEGQICRSPMERAAFSLPVTVGCCYNKCYFCNLFKHLQYRELPLDQIEAELRRVSEMGAAPKTVFLGDGSAFNLPAERLLEILALIRRYFPSRPAVNMDATVPSVLSKTQDSLRALSENGVRRLHIGIETGLDDVLALMNKCHSKPQACEAVERLHEAGIIYDAHIMTGVAGKGVESKTPPRSQNSSTGRAQGASPIFRCSYIRKHRCTALCRTGSSRRRTSLKISRKNEP